MIPEYQQSPSSEPSVSASVDLNTGTPQEINCIVQHEIALEFHPGSESLLGCRKVDDSNDASLKAAEKVANSKSSYLEDD